MEKLQNYKALSHRGYELPFSQTSVRFLHSLSCMVIQTKISEVKPIVSLRFIHFQINFLALLGRWRLYQMGVWVCVSDCVGVTVRVCVFNLFSNIIGSSFFLLPKL